jgi:hypothetical protein
MKILDIAQHVNLSLVVERTDLSQPAREILHHAITCGDVDKFFSQDGNLDEYSKDGMLGLIQIREKGLTDQRREHYGFLEAMEIVKCLPEDEKICWLAIETTNHLLVILVRISNFEVIGCMSVSRSNNLKPQLPEIWDGSAMQ